MDCSLPDFSIHGNFPGKNTGVGCHFLQGLFPTQGSNLGPPRLLHRQADSLPLCHLGSPLYVHYTTKKTKNLENKMNSITNKLNQEMENSTKRIVS